MPKHVPTFKHLLSSSSQSQDPPPRREKSVKDLLANARVNNPVVRDVPPHQSDDRAWSPGVNAGAVAGSSGTLLDIEHGAIHPAELLRRSILSRRQASRGVAGPAPPLSWHVPNAQTPTSTIKTASTSASTKRSTRKVTSEDLFRSSDFFPRSHGSSHPAKLVEHCLHAVLRHLESDTIMTEHEGSSCTVGWAMREQVGYLETHLKVALMDAASLLPEGSRYRLSDRSLRAILVSPDGLDGEDADEEPGECVTILSSSSSSSNWENDQISRSTTIPHLPLTLHPSPTPLLRQVLNFPSVSLASLNLAYSTIDLESLTTLLPTGLRELSLCGVRPSSKTRDVAVSWRRGLSNIARKLILLKILDLSYQPIDNTGDYLRSLLHPSTTKVPSLRLLGLRGVTPAHDVSEFTGCLSLDDATRQDPVLHNSPSSKLYRTALLEIIRSEGRQRYIHVEWE